MSFEEEYEEYFDTTFDALKLGHQKENPEKDFC